MAIRPNDAPDLGAVNETDSIPIDRVGSTAAAKTTPGRLQAFVLMAQTFHAWFKTMFIGDVPNSNAAHRMQAYSGLTSGGAALFSGDNRQIDQGFTNYPGGTVTIETPSSSSSALNLMSCNTTLPAVLTMLRSRPGGGLPLAGDHAGRLMWGFVASPGGNGYSVGAIIMAFEEDVVQGSAYGTSMRFTTAPLSAGNAVERMRIKPAGTLNLSAVATFADNAAALAGGLVAGDVYRTATGQLMITF